MSDNTRKCNFPTQLKINICKNCSRAIHKIDESSSRFYPKKEKHGWSCEKKTIEKSKNIKE